jgi:hypothetical protein
MMKAEIKFSQVLVKACAAGSVVLVHVHVAGIVLVQTLVAMIKFEHVLHELF